MEVCKLTATREGRRIEFDVRPGQPVVLGRSRECAVVLKDPEVSRQHCRVAAANGRLLVTDLDSSHGIVYRGERVQMLEIELGDGFHVGHTFVRFDAILHDASQPEAPTPPTPVVPAAETMPLPSGPRPPVAATEPVAEPDPLAATSTDRGPTDLPAGTVVGGFVIDRAIGRSDRCTVYEASQPALQRHVALKVLQAADGMVGAEERATFLADLQANAAIRDGALVPVLAGGQDGPHCFAAMELVEGTTLSQTLVATQRMNWRELVPVLADVATALQRLHEQGHVHGAVKPSNVFTLLRGGGRLADLRAGTALRARETTAYASPELLRGQPLDVHSDLYSLGCVAYAAIVGKPPYWGSAKQILEEQRTRRPADLTALDPTLPRALDALVCGQLLALDPADRPASAAACRDVLLALTNAGTPTTPVAFQPPRPAPVAAPEYAPTPRAEADDPARAPMLRRQPSAAKSFGARLAADSIIFGMVAAVLFALLLLLKVANAFDLYAFFGVNGKN